MRLKISALTFLFALSSLAVVNSQTLPSALKPVHKSVGASCLPGFHAQPQTYDNLDSSAHYMCYGPPPVCAANMAVWWEEPPGVTSEPRFRYSCQQVQASASSTATCAPGFSASYLRAPPPQEANVKYVCSSAPVACPAVFSINQDDPDFYGFKSGGYMYKCTKIS